LIIKFLTRLRKRYLCACQHAIRSQKMTIERHHLQDWYFREFNHAGMRWWTQA
jgi:hypothetical protein